MIFICQNKNFMKTVYKWFERFRNGCESAEDEEGSGRPSTSKTQENVERVSKMIRTNRQLTIREISEHMNISYGSIQNILTTDLNIRQVSVKFVRVLMVKQTTTDLNIRQVSVKFVPCVLMVKQTQQRLSISLELRDRAASDSSFLGNIMGDETWVYGYDPETRVQSSQWKSPSSPRVKKACQSRSNIKVMIVFFDLHGIV